MNFYEISNKYPNAWAVVCLQLKGYMRSNLNIVVTADNKLFINGVLGTLSPDVLYKAFEMEGLCILLTYDGKQWGFKLFSKIGPSIEIPHVFLYREIATIHAITAAFEYLEKYYMSETNGKNN